MAKKNHTEIVNVISWFYENIRGFKPDSREFGMEYKRLEKLMFPEEKECIGYTEEEIIDALKYLDNEGIVMNTLGILQYPHLLAAIVRGNAVFKRQMMQSVQRSQKDRGLSRELQNGPPNGW